MVLVMSALFFSFAAALAAAGAAPAETPKTGSVVIADVTAVLMRRLLPRTFPRLP